MEKWTNRIYVFLFCVIITYPQHTYVWQVDQWLKVQSFYKWMQCDEMVWKWSCAKRWFTRGLIKPLDGKKINNNSKKQAISHSRWSWNGKWSKLKRAAHILSMLTRSSYSWTCSRWLYLKMITLISWWDLFLCWSNHYKLFYGLVTDTRSLVDCC